MKTINNINNKEGFTLIEVLVVLAIIGIISWIILVGITQYIEKSKNSNIEGTLGSLILAGEVYYNNNNSYLDFCDSSVVKNAKLQLPKNSFSQCYDSENNPAGICCGVDSTGDRWAICAYSFRNDKAYCVDSRGIKKEINKESCVDGLVECD